MKTSEVLFGAIDVLRERGWCQHIYEDKDGHICMMTAVMIASGKRSMKLMDWSDHAVGCFAVMQTIMHVTECSVGEFNNFHCKSIDDACAALEIVACCSAAKGD